jgi:hypothetical protein
VHALLEVVDCRPDLVAFWRSTWVPDETFVPSILNSPALVPGWTHDSTNADLWYIGWDGRRRKSPPYLRMSDFDTIFDFARRPGTGLPRLFARKFSSALGTQVLDAIDGRLRAPGGSAP